MNNDENETTVEDNNNNNVEETGKEVTQPSSKGKTEGESEKTFTQSEVNALLRKEKEKSTKGVPTKEELEAFRAWQESQKSAEQKNTEKEIKYQEISTENEDLKKENLLFRKGVTNADDVEFLVFKISKMDGDFEDNVDNFLKENPKYTAPVGSEKENDGANDDKVDNTSNGVATRKNDIKTVSNVDAILRARHPDLFKEN